MNIRIFEVPEIPFPVHYHSSRDVFESMKPYAKADREMLLIIFLNSQGCMVGHEVHTVGSGNASAVYPNELFRSVLLAHAQSIILVHNHPSGNPQPSIGDDEITKIVVFGAHLLGIKVLDHVILGTQGYYSYGDSGRIEEYDIKAQQTMNGAAS